ncbi:MAG: hypothetical protein U9R05_04100, partial [Chloroflexota bacterium]|nr:hypothetical protein [Chloroflexota bacterium]
AFVAFPGNWARLQRQWGAVVESVADVARADSPQIPDDLETALVQLSDNGWPTTIAALRAIVEGTRDPDALAEELELSRKSYLIVVKTLESLAGAPRDRPPRSRRPRRSDDVQPAVRGLAPLVLGVVALAQGQESLRPQVVQGLDQLAQQPDWRALADALESVLAGARDRDALAPALDAVDVQLLDLALGALAGEAAAQSTLEQLAQEAQQQSQPDAAQLQQLQQAFQAWLQSPAGQAAIAEAQAQGLAQQAAMEQLLSRFLQE